jgi:hypothetical protein
VKLALDQVERASNLSGLIAPSMVVLSSMVPLVLTWIMRGRLVRRAAKMTPARRPSLRSYAGKTPRRSLP